jgi:hypothetical protein
MTPLLIPRREFLGMAAATAISLGLDPFRGITVTDDQYRSDRLGLELRRPRGWEFESVADLVALREHKVLQDAIAGEPHPLRDPNNLPLFLIVDPSHRRGDFAPAIVLYDERLDGPVPSNEPAAHAWMLRTFSRSYRDLLVHREPRDLRLVGAQATDAEWRYLHELDDGRSWLMRIRSVLVFRPPRVHTFYLADSDDHPWVPRRTFDAFLRTITYRPV